MTIDQIHERFLHYYDKQSNYSAPEISAEEIDIYLNRDQEDFIDELIAKGVEKTGEYLDYLKNITISYSTTTFSAGTKTNGYLVGLPVNYRSSLLEQIDISYSSCGVTRTSRVPVIPITRDEYNNMSVDPFNEPWKEECKRLTQSGNFFEVLVGTGITPVKYYMDYIKVPAKMQYGSQYATPVADVQCELDEKAQNIIIDKAVIRALKTLGDPRLQLENISNSIKTIK